MIAAPPLDDVLQEGLAFHRAGRLAEAARCYRNVIAVAPDHADALHLLGLVEHAGANNRAAIALLRRAILLRPDIARFRANLGTVCLAVGDLADAEHSFRAATERAPEDADALANLGLTLLRAKRPAEAEAPLRAAVVLEPKAVDALANLGACLHQLGRVAEAAPVLRRALAIDPAHTPALACLALVLEALGHPSEAEACHRTALARQPDSAASLTNLGNLLRARGRLDEAAAMLRRAVALRCDNADAWHNLATVLIPVAPDEAAQCCRRALALDPGHADAHYTLGTVQLLGGQMPQGFAGLEWRWRRRGFAAPRSLAAPRWDGSPLAGRSLLLHAEQGFGDTIQMLRFVPALAEAGRLVLDVPATMRDLAAALHPAVRVTAPGDALPATDLECPLPSLPYALGLTLARMPRDVPYLRPDPARVAAWAARVATLPGRRVGLAWAGNPLHVDDARRSIPPEQLASLLLVPDISFVSLQVGPKPVDLPLHDWTPDLRTFADTAALVQTLDLTISADSAVAHLAGALGRPIWLLNRFDTDWRWLREGDDCPWYPTLRQFRQPAPGDWSSAVAAAASCLAKWAPERAEKGLNIRC